MKWSTDVPTVPGWYWYRMGKAKPLLVWVYCYLPLNQWWIDWGEIEDSLLEEFLEASEDNQFAGPIPEPEE